MMMMMMILLFNCKKNYILFNAQIDLSTLRQLVAERGVRYYPRLKNRVVYASDEPYWDPVDFRIENHVKLASLRDPYALIDETQFREYLHQILGRPLDENLPMWEFHLIQNYQVNQSAIIFRIHHCYADGLALVGFLLDLVDNRKSIKLPFDSFASKVASPTTITANNNNNNNHNNHNNNNNNNSEEKRHHGQEKEHHTKAHAKPAAVGFKWPPFWKLLVNQLLFPIGLIRRTIAKPDRNKLHIPGRKLHGTLRVAWTERIGIERIKKLKQQANVSFNDILLACLSGAFRRYFQHRKQAVIEDVHLNMSMSMRPSHEEKILNNKFTVILVTLPVGEADPRRRLQRISQLMDGLKLSPEPLGTYLIEHILIKCPTKLTKWLLNDMADKTTITCSNVPGPTTPLYFGGRQIYDLLYFVPSLGTIGVGCSLLSYNGGVRMAVNIDSSLCEDPRLLVAGFMAEVDELYRLYVC